MPQSGMAVHFQDMIYPFRVPARMGDGAELFMERDLCFLLAGDPGKRGRLRRRQEVTRNGSIYVRVFSRLLQMTARNCPTDREKSQTKRKCFPCSSGLPRMGLKAPPNN